jgi:hypothetical protein
MRRPSIDTCSEELPGFSGHFFAAVVSRFDTVKGKVFPPVG